MEPPDQPVALSTIAREWGRIGCTGFGGPPAHIALLRQLCVQDRGWLSPGEMQDAIAATNLLPGPASTQLSIYCAWRLRGVLGALVGGFCFIVPGLVLILFLAALFLARHAPLWVSGAAAGAGSAVAAVALGAAARLMPASWARVGAAIAGRARWVGYAAAGAASSALIGPYLVLVLLAAGLAEVGVRHLHRPSPPAPGASSGGSDGGGGAGPLANPGHLVNLPRLAYIVATVVPASGLGALAWVAFKVGALSYGGGFVIVPLMQSDAVHHYHWMTNAQFLDAVALGQVTPGPVVQTVAVVGYAAAGIGGGLLAAAIAFAPSFLFILFGARRFGVLRANPSVQAFLTGAGPAAIGAIAGSSIPLALALAHIWQVGVLAAAVLWLLPLRRGVVACLLAAGVVGVVAAFAGLPVR
ncbi:MAG TPA: chromate efflux transporter [Acidimicrobiales bacterium]|nr:chromate efflux transporter [Acidimicrobiales bacterium]